MTKEAMKLAIEALNTPRPFDSYPPLWRTYENTINTAIKALEEALKQEQDEPVAYVYGNGDNDPILSWSRWDKSGREGWYETPLYTTPQTKEWVGLTEDEMFDCLVKFDPVAKRLPLGFKWFAEAIEAKLKDKNT